MKSRFDLFFITLLSFLLMSCSGTNSNTVKKASAARTHTAATLYSEQCKQRGGRWIRANLVGFYGCLRPAPDAGKSCSDYSDCKYDCLARKGESPKPGQAATGQCQANNSYTGCRIEIRKGIAQPKFCINI